MHEIKCDRCGEIFGGETRLRTHIYVEFQSRTQHLITYTNKIGVLQINVLEYFVRKIRNKLQFYTATNVMTITTLMFLKIYKDKSINGGFRWDCTFTRQTIYTQ